MMDSANARPMSAEEESHQAELNQRTFRRAQGFWMLWAFLPALLTPVGFLALQLGLHRYVNDGWLGTLLVLTPFLYVGWILFCVTRIQIRALPGTHESTHAHGCGLFMLLTILNFFAAVALLYGSCALFAVLLP
jgi:hypothetical protein